MADTKVTDLTAASSVAATDHLYGVVGGNSRKVPAGLFAPSAKVDDLVDSLSGVFQSVGYAGTIPDGTTSVGAGTFTLATAITKTGRGVKFSCFGRGTGTGYVQIVSRSGTTNTIVREQAVSIVPGYQTIYLENLDYEAGQFCGYRGSGLVAASSGSVDPYWATGSTIASGGTYVDADLTAGKFHLRFDLIEQTVNSAKLSDLSTSATWVGSDADAGPDGGTRVVIGRPEADTLVTGSNAGTAYYVMEAAAQIDMRLVNFSIYGMTAGEIELSVWDGPDSAATKIAGVSVFIATGANEFETPGLVLRKGQRLAVRRVTGIFAINSDTINPTPYRSITETSGALSSLFTAVRFEFSAAFKPWTLTSRVADLETVDPSVDFPRATTGFQMLWILGESHAAGRAMVLGASVASGRGYAYRRATTSLATLSDPTGNDGTAIAGDGRGSFGPPIGQGLLDMSAGATGAVIVNSGVGGATLAVWATAGSAWVEAKADWDAAVAAVKADKIPITGLTIAIAIGSNDAGIATTKADYKAALLDLITRARAYAEAGSDAPIALVQTAPFADGTYAAEVLSYQQAQAELVQSEAGVFMASTAQKYAAERGWFMDNVHFTQSGNNAIGAGIAAVSVAHGSGRYPVSLD